MSSTSRLHTTRALRALAFLLAGSGGLASAAHALPAYEDARSTRPAGPRGWDRLVCQLTREDEAEDDSVDCVPAVPSKFHDPADLLQAPLEENA